MKYRQFIEDKFLIDKSETGELVPFRFRPVQVKYYEDLCRDYDIEKYGLNVPIRENILKARKEGFSSLLLALFAADDIISEHATGTTVLSYKDDATAIFRKRYRNFILSYYAPDFGLALADAASNIVELEKIAPHVFSIDSTELELEHNRASFQCATAGARVGGRGGVMHKILFSEVAFYQDTDKIRAAEMIEATMRQVDPKSGWIFMESTENGPGTYQHKTWTQAKLGQSRFKNRFYGTGEFYNEEEIALIRSEYVDMDAFRRDYPMTEEDLFKGSANNFTTIDALEKMVGLKEAEKDLVYWTMLRGTNYVDQCEIILNAMEILEKRYPKAGLYVGIDQAKINDATIFTVLKGRDYTPKGGIRGVAIDSTGQGDFMPDWFERNSRHYIIRVKFSRQTKDIMYRNLQTVIADRSTSLPVLKEGGEWTSEEAGEFVRQMTELQKREVGFMLVVEHPKDTGSHENYEDGKHDDFPDSWCLAEHAYTTINGVQAREKKPEADTVPSALKNMLENKVGRDRGRYGSTSEYE